MEINFEYFKDRGFHTFPCWPGKKPGVEHWKETSQPNRIAKNGGVYGVAIPKGFLVVDVDAYKPGANESYEKLTRNSKTTPLMSIKTGRGGFHHWFRIPPHMKIGKKSKIYPGIDFLTEGCYTIGPGSVIEGGSYDYIQGGLPYINELDVKG